MKFKLSSFSNEEIDILTGFFIDPYSLCPTAEPYTVDGVKDIKQKYQPAFIQLFSKGLLRSSRNPTPVVENVAQYGLDTDKKQNDFYSITFRLVHQHIYILDDIIQCIGKIDANIIGIRYRILQPAHSLSIG